MRNSSCDGCIHYLGGGCCRINAEAECREGGGFELWENESHESVIPCQKLSRSEQILKWGAIILMFLAYPLVLYKFWQWVKYLWEVCL